MLFNSQLKEYTVWYDKICDILDSYDYYSVVTYTIDTPYKEFLFGKSLLGKKRDEYCIKILKNFLRWKDVKGLCYIRDIIPSIKGIKENKEIIDSLTALLKSDDSTLIDIIASIFSELRLYDKIPYDAIATSTKVKAQQIMDG